MLKTYSSLCHSINILIGISNKFTVKKEKPLIGYISQFGDNYSQLQLHSHLHYKNEDLICTCFKALKSCDISLN